MQISTFLTSNPRSAFAVRNKPDSDRQNPKPADEISNLLRFKPFFDQKNIAVRRRQRSRAHVANDAILNVPPISAPLRAAERDNIQLYKIIPKFRVETSLIVLSADDEHIMQRDELYTEIFREKVWSCRPREQNCGISEPGRFRNAPYVLKDQFAIAGS